MVINLYRVGNFDPVEVGPKHDNRTAFLVWNLMSFQHLQTKLKMKKTRKQKQLNYNQDALFYYFEG